jgi:aminoglycoside 3-N-acetyltransferase
MSEKQRALIARTHEQFGTCLIAERLKEDFQKLGISAGMTLLVHCSLSKIGWICGGPVTVIQVLLDLLGPDGTLVMPSHTADNSDPKYWSNPSVPSEWFDIIRQSMPGFQPDITPTRNMGKVAETFRHWPGVLRSQHPQYSVIAIGPKAKLITDKHDDACGEQSPLARLYDCTDNGYVLLLGVQHENNTSLHLGEYRYQINHNIEKSFILGASVLDPKSNTRQWIEWNDYDYDAEDFNDVGNAFESIEGNTKIGKVGLAECRLMKQHLLVDFAVDWMIKNRLKQKNHTDS